VHGNLLVVRKLIAAGDHHVGGKSPPRDDGMKEKLVVIANVVKQSPCRSL